ncbi:blue light sensor protein [Pseudomonas sp. HMWF032]|uniref:BLUF domain-containing protein n=1 Tax=unclassified Pseudomonas TaxID=196821 RepID=UPI000D3B63C7|nr:MULTISPECIES: BLUF domain-containing protein [unclassified Pseudomonas]PTS82046.1 blue light sensor protein [Pseudomonas sp. HMWF032]PTT85752.1 blue light sensor protein [Pseudomonas sp. HMWF010]WAC45790.1 BLUF domain-containing protein [Pseudomonas sp. SL4(2022)]
MYLVRLLYVSKVVNGLGAHEIDALLQVARQHNAKVGITGMLAFNGEFFLQVLEGGRTAVNQLYQHIALDSRHEQLLLLQVSEIDERQFPEWSMAYVPITKLTRDLLLRFGVDDDFRPYQMNGSNCLGLLMGLRERFQIAKT